MIDKSKNACYLIYIYYTRNDKECSQKFISQHQADSKRFKEFSADYFKNVFPVSPKRMGNFDGVISSQQTISLEYWPKVKNTVLEGITEQEKCY